MQSTNVAPENQLKNAEELLFEGDIPGALQELHYAI